MTYSTPNPELINKVKKSSPYPGEKKFTMGRSSLQIYAYNPLFGQFPIMFLIYTYRGRE